jgi:hypothetical protein
MTDDEKREILSKHLAKFRKWDYADLAQAASIGGGHLELLDEVAADGTRYTLNIDVFWDDKPDGDVRVCGYFYGNQQKPLFRLLPVSLADVADGIIMSRDGRFVGEGTMRVP